MGTNNQEEQLEKELGKQILENDELIKIRDFVNEVKRRVQERVDDNQKVRMELVPKNNGVTFIGLIIITEDRNISPTIYLNDYYDKYVVGMTMDEIVDDILIQYNANLPTKDFDIRSFINFENIKDKIIMKMVNTKLNKELLDDLPSREFADLSLIYMVYVGKSENGYATVTIHKQHMDMWNVTEEEIYNLAMKNTPKLFRARVDSMFSLYDRVLRDLIVDIDNVNMHVLTNNVNIDGAVCLRYPAFLKGMYTVFQDKFYIIPSSVHEVIIVPKTNFEELFTWKFLRAYYIEEIEEDIEDRKYQCIEDIPQEPDVDLEEISIKEINKMILLTNTEQLRDIEVLGNHVYICDGEKLIWFDEETNERKEFVL